MKNKRFKAALAAILLTASTVLSSAPAMAANVRTTSADGAVTYGNSSVKIDASHVSDGYVMVKYTGSASRIKVRIKKDTEYTYDLNTSGNYETFPLTEGSGSYSVQIYENVQSNLYSIAVSQNISVTIADANSPFLYPNQFCNFNTNSTLVATADQLVDGKTDTLQKVEAVYNWVSDILSYDYN